MALAVRREIAPFIMALRRPAAATGPAALSQQTV
jgi:hypothetical protein